MKNNAQRERNGVIPRIFSVRSDPINMWTNNGRPNNTDSEEEEPSGNVEQGQKSQVRADQGRESAAQIRHRPRPNPNHTHTKEKSAKVCASCQPFFYFCFCLLFLFVYPPSHPAPPVATLSLGRFENSKP